MTHLQESSDPTSTQRTLSRRVVWSIVLLLIVAAVAITGIVVVQHRTLARQTEARLRMAQAGPLVRTLVLGEGGTLADAMVQGEALPFQSATLYARASGFLKEIRVDKGSPVRKGQILAVIEGQELDHDLAGLKADAENKRSNAERYAALLRDRLISAKDAEQAQADARVAEAKVASLGISRAYQEVRAPFAGMVTQRFVDPGAMVQNASTSTNVQPLVTVAQIDRLRVTFYLDQSTARRVKTGDPVRVLPDQGPAQAQQGRISRLSGALDPRTRTLTVEADLDNRQGLFLAGASVKVLLGNPGQSGFMLPLEALAQRQGKPFTLVVDGTAHVHLRSLTLGEDNGQRVRVLQGLQSGERVVLNPPPGLGEGSLVRLAETGKGAGSAK